MGSCTKPKAIAVLITTLYFISTVFPLLCGILWLFTEPEFRNFDKYYKSIDLTNFAFMQIIMSSIETFLSLITLILFLCGNLRNMKALVWITAFVSIGPLVTIFISYANTSESDCIEIFNEITDDIDHIIAGCLDPHLIFSVALALFLMMHFFMLAYIIIENYGFTENANPPQTTTTAQNEKERQIYKQELVSPQPFQY